MPAQADQTRQSLSPQDEAFLQVLAHHTMLRAYIFAIVQDRQLVEDTLSDVTLAIVRSWERFDQRQPFAPWARGVARRVALTNRRRQQRHQSELSEQVLEMIGAQIEALGMEAQLEEQREQLRLCLEKLPPRSRELVQMRYYEDQSYDLIAQQTGRTMDALYKAFSRIHEALGRCVKHGGSPL